MAIKTHKTPTPHPGKTAAPPAEPTPGRETRFYVVFGALTLLLASIPYLYGYLNTPPGMVYTGLGYNIDDNAVYFSWMRQAENGGFFLRNQFSVEEQRGVLFNLFFWLLGSLVRVTGLSTPAVYHAARVVVGALLLGSVTALLRATLTASRARQTAFSLVCVSAGFGWLWVGRVPEGGIAQPIDLWQPEAITFLSLYFTPLFTAALALMIVFLTAMLRAERTGRLRDVWPAAAAGALIGNFHSYDVIHLFAVWGSYRALTDTLRRRFDPAGWARLIVVGLAALPTTAYQYWALRVEPIFYERAFVSATWSQPLWWVLLGYGLTALLAILALVRFAPRLRDAEADPRAAPFVDPAALRFLLTWAVIGIAVSYVPVAFQRKMLMGAHLPLCALAGVMLDQLTARLPGNLPRIAVAGAVLLTLPSNVWFLSKDLGRIARNEGSTPHRPYLTRNEWDALQWLRRNTTPRDAVLVGLDPSAHLRFPYGFAFYPHLSVFVPAFAGNVVYNGHWSETSRFERKMGVAGRFFRAATPDAVRQEILRENGIRYILFVNALGAADVRDASGNRVYEPVPWPQSAPPYLQRVYANPEITIYRAASP